MHTIFVLTMLFTFVDDRKNENHYSLLGIQTPVQKEKIVHNIERNV